MPTWVDGGHMLHLVLFIVLLQRIHFSVQWQQNVLVFFGLLNTMNTLECSRFGLIIPLAVNWFLHCFIPWSIDWSLSTPSTSDSVSLSSCLQITSPGEIEQSVLEGEARLEMGAWICESLNVCIHHSIFQPLTWNLFSKMLGLFSNKPNSFPCFSGFCSAPLQKSVSANVQHATQYHDTRPWTEGVWIAAATHSPCSSQILREGHVNPASIDWL